MKIIMRLFIKYSPLLLVLFFAILSSFSLFHAGLFPTHDGEYHVIRFYEFDKVLRDGNLYPRWAPDLNNGFGVPLLSFVYPLPNYVASLLHLINISFIDSFKINMIVASIIGGVFFYLWSKEFWGKLGGVVSSVFYTFSPYHFVDIYIRGSVGEVWALGLFPAFLWAYTKFARSRRRVFLILSSIFLALIIFSHNILALMFFIFSLSYIVLKICLEKNRKFLILNTFCLILLGLGLSAIFWFPALLETKYVTGLRVFDVAAHFPELYQLLIPSWGSGFSGAGIQNELSYQIGLANLLVIFLSVAVIMLQIKRKNSKFLHTIFFLACFILTFYLMLSVSLPIWKIIPLMNYFQFPWRLLSVEILFASFLAGSIFSLNIKNKYINLLIAMFLIFIVYILGIGYAKPAYYMYRNDNYYITRPNFIDGTNSPGNVFNTVYLKLIPTKEKERAVFIKGMGKIIANMSKSNYYQFEIQADVDSEIQVNLAYFPGWEVYINSKKGLLKPTQDGRFAFSVVKGENKVEILFKDTLIRKIAMLISVTSLEFLFLLLINKRFVTIKK
jgi:uncharacterized membrane protein